MNKKRSLLALLCVCVLFVGGVKTLTGTENSDQPNLSSISKPWTPQIKLEEAIKQAKKFIKKESIDVSDFYLRKVKLIFHKDKGLHWYLSWSKSHLWVTAWISLSLWMAKLYAWLLCNSITVSSSRRMTRLFHFVCNDRENILKRIGDKTLYG